MKILRIHKEMALENPDIHRKMHLKMTKIKVFIPQNSQFLILYDHKAELPGLEAIFGPNAPGTMIHWSLVIDNDLDDLVPLDRLNFPTIQ